MAELHLTFTLPDGSSYELGPLDEAATIGRAEGTASIALPCESLSDPHAIIEATADGGGWQLRDLDSTNGIHDGSTQAEAFLLSDGCPLYLGDVRLDPQLVGDPAPRVATAAPVLAPRGQGRPVSAAAQAHAQRFRAAQARRDSSSSAILIGVLAIAAFGIGFAVRFLQG